MACCAGWTATRVADPTRQSNRRIAITPIHLDLTGRRLLRRLHTWAWDLPSPAEAPDLPAADAPTGAIDPLPDDA